MPLFLPSLALQLRLPLDESKVGDKDKDEVEDEDEEDAEDEEEVHPAPEYLAEGAARELFM